MSKHHSKAENAQECEEIQWPDSKPPPDYESTYVNGSLRAKFLPQLTANKETAKNEKQIDSDPAVGNERQPGIKRLSIRLSEVVAKVPTDHKQDGYGSQTIEERKLTRGRVQQFGK